MADLDAKQADLEALIRQHLRLHPGFEARDLLKLLYQGAMGMDHLLANREGFIEELRREWETLAPALPDEVPLEPVHPSAPIARLNLRPAKAAGARLTDVGPFLADQPLRLGPMSGLWALWEEATALAREGRIPFAADDLAHWGEALRSRGHPPGHSARYREMSQPAYRLIHDTTRPEARALLARIRGATRS